MTESRAAEQLQELVKGRTIVIGVGNPMLGDDGAGPRLIELLEEAGSSRLRLINGESAPERHFGEVEAAAPEAVLLVDAVDFGAACGTVAFFEEESLPQRTGSTHDVPLRLVMQYLRRTTGAKVGLVGIQPAQTAFAGGLSAPVEDAVQWLASILAAEPQLEAWVPSASVHEEIGKRHAWVNSF